MKKGIRINKKKLKRLAYISSVLIMVLVCLVFFPSTLSRYSSIGEGSAKVNIAFSLLNVDDLSEYIMLDKIKPDDDYQQYTFSVKNYDEEGNRIDVNMVYNIVLTTTTNIPVTFQFLDENGDVLEASLETIVDGYGTYFNKLSTEDFNVSYDKNSETTFTIKYNLSTDYKSEEYQDLAELIKIEVNAHQAV